MLSHVPYRYDADNIAGRPAGLSSLLRKLPFPFHTSGVAVRPIVSGQVLRTGQSHKGFLRLASHSDSSLLFL